jgi:RNA polymerase sigma factor (sigma-70 family)
MESIEAQPPGEGSTSRAAQVASLSAQDELDLAEYSDLLDEIERLSPEERAILQGIGYESRTLEDVAQELGVTSRTISNRLKAIRRKLRMRYEHGAGSEDDEDSASSAGGDNDEPA